MLARSTSPFRKRRSPDRSLRFGVFWPYSRTQVASARISALNPEFLDIETHARLARLVEQIGMDFVLIADGYASQSERGSEIGFQDPSSHAILWAVPLLMATTHLGVVSTMHTTYLHPIHLARFGAHLDFLGGGRWGWNIVTGFRENEARLFGFDDLGSHATRYAQAEESVSIVKRLWADPRIEHAGEFYTIRGRMRAPLPPEMPLLVSAASSGPGRSFAVRHCDYLFASTNEMEEGADLIGDVRKKSALAGRDEPPRVLILSDIFVRDGLGAARQEYDDLMGSLDEEAQQVVTRQFARLNTKKPGITPAIVGTESEVVDQIVDIAERGLAEGVVVRMPLWNIEEAQRLGGVFDRLARTAVWSPPETRQHCW